MFSSNDISADMFLKQIRTNTPSVDLGILGRELIPLWKELVNMVETKEVFKSIENTNYFFTKLKYLYKNTLVELINYMSNNQVDTSNLCGTKMIDLFTTLIKFNIHLEPFTKLFLEDLYSVMYIKNSNRILSQHFGLASLPIVNYRIGIKGLVINTNLEQVPVECDISRLLSKCGEKGTLEVIQLLLCILINYVFYNHKDELDYYLPKHTAYSYGNL